MRCINSLGRMALEKAQNWDLSLQSEEEREAENALASWRKRLRFIACCTGTKMQAKDWGAYNWQALIQTANKRWGNLGIVFVGAGNEFKASESVRRCWRGPSLNLCGKLSPRESAALIKRAVLFIGHDSGPMHLASAVGTPIVAIFSARNKPGVWFPNNYRTRHKVLYHQTDCWGCELEVCTKYGKKCISSISVGEVLQAIEDLSGSFDLFS